MPQCLCTTPSACAPSNVSGGFAMLRPRSLLSLFGFAATVFGAGWLAARFGPTDLRTQIWYRRLRKPGYNPPQLVFPAVWTGLYALIALSGWRIWESPLSAERSRALRLWVAQLATNVEPTHPRNNTARPFKRIVCS